MAQYSPGTQRFNKIKSYFIVGVITFGLAVIVSLTSTFFLQHITSLILAFMLLLVIILIGIIFDTIGTAATAATEPPFHAKAADRVTGGAEAVMLVRNADKVANLCGDVGGDVCGTISGAIGAIIAVRVITQKPTMDEIAVSVFMSSIIAAITVGGKAAGKSLAINRANDIIFIVGKILAWVRKITGRKGKMAGKMPARRRK